MPMSALRPLAIAALAAAPLLLAAPRARAQGAPAGAAEALPAQVEGVVRGPGGAVVAGAEVLVTPATPSGGGLVVARRLYTADDGVFRVGNLPPGGATVAVRRMGYRPASLPVTLPTARLEIALEPVPQKLATVVVRERTRGPYTGWMRHFNRRRDAGFGRFISRADIERQNPMITTDLLRTVPGVQIRGGAGGNSVRIRNATCPPFIWIDGAPATAGYIDLDAFSPMTVEGLEVYSGPATVPPELRGPRGEDRCGVIALWSRVPEPRPRSKRKALTAADLAQLVEQATVFTEEQVDVPVQADTVRPVVPRYPEELRRAHVPGEARVEFVVDTLGKVETETLNVASATHPLFGQAARDAIFSAEFLPAQRQGRRVRQLVLLTVRFGDE